MKTTKAANGRDYFRDGVEVLNGIAVSVSKKEMILKHFREWKSKFFGEWPSRIVDTTFTSPPREILLPHSY